MGSRQFFRPTPPIAALALACLPAVAAPPGEITIGSRWAPTLIEEFNGPELDGSIWSVSDQDGRPNGNNGVRWGWSANNVSVQDGALVIATTSDGDGTFSSGHVWTKDKWSQTYGYFEARIKLPPANNGHQAAFWMTAQDNGHFSVGSDGRDGAEIDVVETPDASDHFRTGLHWDGYGADHKSSGGQVPASGIHAGFHDFGLLWDADSLRYYYDGRLVRTYSGVGVPRVAEVLRASVGILNWCDGDIRAASLPQYTYFDSINAWQLQAGDSLHVLDDMSPEIRLIGDGWQSKASTSDHRGTMSQSGDAGDAVEFSFIGSAADVFVRTGLYGGLVDVYVDGQLVAPSIDTYASTPTFQQLLQSVDALRPGLHNLRLEVTGRRNPNSVASLLMLDAVQYVPLAATESIGIDIADPAATQTQAVLGFPSLEGQQPVVKTGAGRLVLTAANPLQSSFVLAEGTVVASHPLALAAATLDVADGATLSMSPSANPLHVRALGTILGTIDLGTGGLVVADSADSVIPALQGLLRSGRADGTWTGASGITSSAIARFHGTRSIGYRLESDGSARIAFAAPGDIDLGGQVNVFDLVGINGAGRYGTGAESVWAAGDFNYDGVTNVFDLVAINTAATYATGDYLTTSLSPAAVPEPSTAWIGVFGILAAACRRRL